MYKHPYFDLLLHDNSELERFINGSIYQRVTLHEWPLSCVQKVVHYDARRYIYKAQSGPTVEAEFYALARSQLLVGARTLYREDPYACLLLEHLEAPILESLELSEEAALGVGKELLTEIARVTGEKRRKLPFYINVSTSRRWVALVKETLALLKDLVDRGVFRQVDPAMIDHLRGWALDSALLSLFDGPVGLVHGDLGGDNIFVLPDGYRVIDWQRPLLGPVDLDLATLLKSLGYDPFPYVRKGVLQALDFLQLRWWVECASRWYPPAHDTYDRLSAEVIDKNGGGIK